MFGSLIILSTLWYPIRHLTTFSPTETFLDTTNYFFDICLIYIDWMFRKVKLTFLNPNISKSSNCFTHFYIIQKEIKISDKTFFALR